MAETRERSKPKSASVCGYPISIFFIVVNEFCERFSYYGMRAVLVLYFKYFLRWDDDFATTIYHTFVALCYLTPIFGAIIADSWLGKFKTIVYLSIVYAAGQVIMAVSAIHDITDANKDGIPDNITFHVALSMVGLLLIALGTGGIKPCVAAFGGDQFQDHQEKQRSTFFSIFYLSINAGSLLSTVITPILRAQQCGIHTKQQCYPLAFGVPAALMVVALIVFILGSGMYIKVAPQGNVLVKVCKCIGFAIKNRFRHRHSQYPKRQHWMDWAEEKYDKLLIAQVKMVAKVLFLYLPLPMFWALFDQQGSRWTLQATNMNGDFGILVIFPDQMQTVNPILILVLVPIMDSLIYPLIAKCKLNFTPLKRMTVGMFLAAMAFVAAALVQIQIDRTLPKFPSNTVGQAKFINMLNRSLSTTAGTNLLSLEPYTANEEYLTFKDSFALDLEPDKLYTFTLKDGTRNTISISETEATLFQDLTSKPEQGANAIRVLNGFGSVLNLTVNNQDYGEIVTNDMSDYVQVSHGNNVILIKNPLTEMECVYNQKLGFGSSYTLIIPSTFTFDQNCAQSINAVTDIQPNTVHMAWQIPQYFLITAGEVVFSVTGLEFAYSQAPSNMKSVLQAGWLLTVAVGNIIVLIVGAITLPVQWAEYILFASLLVLVCIVFSIMAMFYTYIDPVKIEAQFSQMEPEDKDKRKDVQKKDSVKKSRKGSSSDSDSDHEDFISSKMQHYMRI
ncbi:solute carrier family 15 member 1b [Cynoglossus semilaevis]|uniref:Intestinal solute carrier family 15 oligopeptide transporter member 1 n=1 Tax=Cynoglossus semilaevis TaxID=244447 RepID=T2B9L0_CYNSE|nr:solute carrier family 15 member 1b [Cynoglossus semilaevis]AGV07610.1 intestinal solute carrier family 15 oligopeptide transporter member 1 [Cynoglossus semilaevis]AGV08357.1 solute carrier family 15 member 1 [Cynoglossus semilaevis]